MLGSVIIHPVLFIVLDFAAAHDSENSAHDGTRMLLSTPA